MSAVAHNFVATYSVNSDTYGNLNPSCREQNKVIFLAKNRSDEQLMEAYRDGDISAFDDLFSRYKDILYRYLLRQSGNKESAEEIFQEAWAALIKNRHTYQVKSTFKTYLFHITHTKLIDYYRQHSKAATISYDEDIEDTYSAPDTADTEQKIDIQLKYEQLLRSLQKLPAAQRDVFLMHEETGMTLQEIAEVMDTTRDTIKSRLRYALQKIRRNMERYQ